VSLSFRVCSLFSKKFDKILEQGYFEGDSLDATAVALFLRNTPFLDPTMVGEYIGKPDEFNIAVSLTSHSTVMKRKVLNELVGMMERERKKKMYVVIGSKVGRAHCHKR